MAVKAMSVTKMEETKVSYERSQKKQFDSRIVEYIKYSDNQISVAKVWNVENKIYAANRLEMEHQKMTPKLVQKLLIKIYEKFKFFQPF